MLIGTIRIASLLFLLLLKCYNYHRVHMSYPSRNSPWQSNARGIRYDQNRAVADCHVQIIIAFLYTYIHANAMDCLIVYYAI